MSNLPISGFPVTTAAAVDTVVPVVRNGSSVTEQSTLGNLAPAIMAGSAGYTASGTSAVGRSVASKLGEIISVKDFGATGNNSTDDTAAIQAAITAAAASGGTVFFPIGTYYCAGTLTISANGLSIKGASQSGCIIRFANGSSDCFLIQGGSQVNSIVFEDLTINGTSKTGGNAINAQVVAYLNIRNVIIGTPYNGVLCYQTNTVTCEKLVINNPSGAYAMKWDSPTANNSSALTLVSCTFAGGYLGADGLVWDGWATTLRMFGVAILSFAHGIWIRNTRASTLARNPQFGYFTDLEIDGASATALQIDAGFDFKFVNCDITNTSGAGGQGSADGYAVAINPDTGYSYTNKIDFIGCRIGLSKSNAMYINCYNARLLGCDVMAGSTTPSGTLAAVVLGSNAADVLIDSTSFYYFGSPLSWAYGVQLNSGATRVQLGRNNFYGVQTAPILDNSGNGNNDLGAGIGGGSVPFGFYRDGAGGHYRADTSTTSTFDVRNNNTGASVQSQLTMTTGTGNSYAVFAVMDNAGSPYGQLTLGSALSKFDLNCKIASSVVATSNYANDTAAAAGGVPLYGLYRNGNAVQIRLV